MYTLADGSKSTDYKIGDRFEVVSTKLALELWIEDGSCMPTFKWAEGFTHCYWDHLKPLNTSSWHEKGEKPPVGTICLADIGSLGWKEAEILKHANNGDIDLCACRVIDGSETGYLKWASSFRPTQSERDKLVEQAKDIVLEWNDGCGKSIGELFVDAGWKPTKEEEHFVRNVSYPTA